MLRRANTYYSKRPRRRSANIGNVGGSSTGKRRRRRRRRGSNDSSEFAIASASARALDDTYSTRPSLSANREYRLSLQNFRVFTSSPFFTGGRLSASEPLTRKPAGEDSPAREPVDIRDRESGIEDSSTTRLTPGKKNRER